MPAALDAIAAVKGRWAGVTDRASLAHPAVNVPASDLVAVLRSLKEEHGFDMLVDVSGVGRPPWQVGESENGGGVAVSSKALSTVTAVAATPPKVTVGVPENPDPKIVTGFGLVSEPP